MRDCLIRFYGVIKAVTEAIGLLISLCLMSPSPKYICQIHFVIEFYAALPADMEEATKKL